MKLHRLKILSEFRGLPAGFEIRFNSSASNGQLLEPICFVGLNGSGKSNVLEVLSEIFYYLETYHLAEKQEIRKFKKSFGFIIEYSLPAFTAEMGKIAANEVGDLTAEETKGSVLISIDKQPNEYPAISAFFGKKKITFNNSDNNRNDAILPKRVIGYSSGMNELISNPYIKMDFRYYDTFRKEMTKAKKEEVSYFSLDMNRLFFMDYESTRLITICNFLFDNKEYGGKDLRPLNKASQIAGLHSFSVCIRLKNNRSKTDENLELPAELNLTIESLKQCATCYEEHKTGKESKTIQFYFWVNDATKEAFQKHFRTAYELYRRLYFLRLLNINLISQETCEKVINARKGTNISDLIPKHEEAEKRFSIPEITLFKAKSKKPVHYEKLSDGEHQLLHVLGMIILMETDGTLFILDEPETHFNPEWRSQFVSLLNDCLQDSERKQEVIVTSHSPFIVSDCKRNKVFSFKRNTRNKVVYSQPDFNTFGASVNLITMKVFGKQETISGLAQKKFDSIKKDYDRTNNKEEAIFETEKLGDSVEKTLLQHYILKGKKE